MTSRSRWGAAGRRWSDGWAEVRQRTHFALFRLECMPAAYSHPGLRLVCQLAQSWHGWHGTLTSCFPPAPQAAAAEELASAALALSHYQSKTDAEEVDLDLIELLLTYVCQARCSRAALAPLPVCR
jgi:hypothetical protein